jgi:hypothetical protein
MNSAGRATLQDVKVIKPGMPLSRSLYVGRNVLIAHLLASLTLLRHAHVSIAVLDNGNNVTTKSATHGGVGMLST